MLPQEKAFLQHLTNYEDLVTPYRETRAGFIRLVTERNVYVSPFIEKARSLRVLAAKAAKAADLADMNEIQPELLTAAGVSDKTAGHLTEEDKKELIRVLIEDALEPANDDFVEELVYRFLLTRGDTIGGTMRNVTGILAQDKITQEIINLMKSREIRFVWNRGKGWSPDAEYTEEVRSQLRGVSWSEDTRNRILVYNRKVQFIGNNIDICLLDANSDNYAERCKKPEFYLAFGELKGGIDPAGADEHWKTARSALDRIRESYQGRNEKPQTFFIGAAIETKMAEEIWDQLMNETLSNAANLTKDDQVDSVINWLCAL